MRDPFGVLGVGHDASASEIDEAWRTRMRRLHPDANPGADETELRRLTSLAAEANDAHARLRRNLAAERLRWSPAQPGAPTPAGMGSDTPVLLPVRIPGGDLFRRPLTWVVLTVALVLGLLLLNQVGSPAPADSPGTPTSLTRSPGWYVGNCVAGDGQFVVPVRCSDVHSGRIVGQVGAEQYCPEVSDGTVYRNNVYYCIDIDA